MAPGDDIEEEIGLFHDRLAGTISSTISSFGASTLRLR
ncbi:hypothetical protein IMCC3088_2138 [Aequoribacter fuscus]|uniref:Uncharacterized protein n=1 Tax=Aequoribacter fuscus TaxID=2518989 RepID=F3L3E6_9GAMM|nr:hypothetical protein IMCC3088_2138 [Aequoribacter fuscus]